VKEFVGDIGNEAERLNRMSTKLLSLSKIDSLEDASCEIVYMEPTIHRVVRMLTTIAQVDNITIILDIHQDSPILIQEDDLYQITFNLAENGIKYNTVGGTLTIALYREEDDAILTVSDTGVGIPTDAVPRLFDRFYRVDKARSRKSGGSGLGLSIVQSLVTRNGGTIGVTSTPGKGSKFTVRFPVFDTEEESQ
jgi:signal transduction histidine kinase